MKNDTQKPGTLYVVATPIGNLEDMTIRAIRVLREVDYVACEDTRVTGKLLKHFEIKKPLISYFQHSQLSKIDHIIDLLKQGRDIALVTDAGTPGISDPGGVLIQRIRENQNSRPQSQNNQSVISNEMRNPAANAPMGSSRQPDDRLPQDDNNLTMQQFNNCIQIIPVPGPSAVAAIASISGMIEKEFYFAGFLPKKKGRQTTFKRLSTLECPIIIYESANRLEKTLGEIKTYFGSETQVFVGREMTKMFETYYFGTPDEVIAKLDKNALKGEVSVVVRRVNLKL